MKLRSTFAVALLLVGLASSSRAGFVQTVQNGPNTYEDVSREHLFFNTDATNGGTLAAGDIVVGFSKLTSASPGLGGLNGGLAANSLYAAFSIQVLGFTNSPLNTAYSTTNSGQGYIVFGVTPSSNPESLQNLLGNVVNGNPVAAGTMITFFDGPSGGSFLTDLTTTLPPPGTSSTNINDYMAYLAKNGTFDFGVGASSPLNANGTNANNDFFYSQLLNGLTTSSANANLINALSASNTFADNFAGLSVLDNNTPVIFNMSVQELTNLGLTFSQFGLTRATEAGAANSGIANVQQFGLNVPPGFPPGTPVGNAATTDNASFVINATVVPEPSSIILFTIGLGGLLGAGYRRHRKSVAQA